MSAAIDLSTPPPARRWDNPARYWPALSTAVAELETPVAALELDALRHNAHDMLRRAAGTPIRIASKSVRVRDVLDAALALDGFAGVLAFTLAEALWLAEGDADHPPVTDVVVAYPTPDCTALRTLAQDATLASRVAVMVDSVDQLDFIDSVLPPGRRETIRVCLELDAAWEAPGLGYLGVRRSPVRTPDQARRLAETIAARDGFTLVGIMAYEAQIAGQGDAPPGKPMWAATVRWMQRHSKAELVERRAAAVAAVRRVADLEFVNGGGTGSLEFTSSDPSITEIGAGSGLLGGHLFDTYRAFTPAPAASFALSVVRRPAEGTVTVLGGGWVASGPPAPDRLPAPVWPPGLRMLPREMAGEVQTPLTGAAARALRVGDRVWFRHTKSGELSEHAASFALVENGTLLGQSATYRGEGKAFL